MKKRKLSPRKERQAKRAERSHETPSRRNFLKIARNGMIGSAVLGGGGLWALSSLRTFAAEHD
ncbi:MAG: hypothetical protein AAGK71_14855, partial [Pseudomonadota bacterium]